LKKGKSDLGKHQTAFNELKPEFIVRQSDLATGEEARVFKGLLPILTDLRKNNEISGFILKNSVQAIADLDKPVDLGELAVLVSQVFETSASLLAACTGGQISYSALEGSKLVVLCLHLGGNQLGMFMEKSADYSKILEKIVSVEI
jgi:predicted regulator of Ras-like GTPase activity (Roadblock/LC7/MglB family)